MRIMLLSLLLTLALSPAVALAGDKPRVVYHVADEDRVSFALNNIKNHINGVGGGAHIDIVLVSLGPAVRRFNDIEAVDRVRSDIAALQAQGVTFEACGNTLEALGLAPDELLPGFQIAEKGGVTRITELQGQGYAYIRP
ncbi:DsrE family protein [uncultured Thiohalocapsa sp.]|uniref:DsrE family protein n=1 Tax=uncultured Thiohalocapsa sp. TaxID=768990 RepID=UPI0025ED530C|nr:DsrE family protein [uncultured Thiohalocapsa sp.]